MTTRAAWLLLCGLALAACEGGQEPTFSVPAELVGTWFRESPVSGVDYLPIAGTRNVVLGTEWEFRADGTFQERHYARELDRGTVSESGIAAGSYDAAAGRLLYLSVQAEAAAPPQAPWPVDLEPRPRITPQQVRLQYTRDGDRLTLTHLCEPDPAALCAGSRTFERR
jgi:hypothetical protein